MVSPLIRAVCGRLQGMGGSLRCPDRGPPEYRSPQGGSQRKCWSRIFVPEHSQFWLFPTWVHQAEQGLSATAGVVPVTHRSAGDGSIPIGALVRVDLIGLVEKEETLSSLRGISCVHILKRSRSGFTIVGRVSGSWARSVWRREPAFMLTPTPEQAGCKTWVTARRATRDGRTYGRDRRRRMGREKRTVEIDSSWPMSATPGRQVCILDKQARRLD